VIALFGLVGCYDTFRDVTYAFFGFLICLATVFARAHGREMLKQAVDSGYFGRPESGGITDETEQAERISAGPWRWVAGPEWALASALVIVLMSLLGAPVIQQSVSGVSGIVRVTPPVTRPSTTSTLSNANNAVTTVQIGRGPNTSLSSAQLYAIRKPFGQYWRTAIFDTYTGRGWDRSVYDSYLVDVYAEPKAVDFAIEPLRLTQVLPVPGEIASWESTNSVRQRLSGVWEVTADRPIGDYRGVAVINGAPSRIRKAQRVPRRLNSTIDVSTVPVEVIKLAQEVARGSTSDYDKAKRIQRAIAERVKYNLNAAATPPTEDPVTYFLFDQKEGYCDLFATSMALMARSVGIPARYVQGYLPDAGVQDNEGRELILDRDYHAWAELYFEDVGWIIFDATEGAQQVAGGERGAALDTEPWFRQPWVQPVIDGLIGLAALVGLFAAYRGLRHQQAQRTNRTEVEACYRRFANALARPGNLRRPVGQTPNELLALASASLGEAYDEAAALNRRFSAALYGPGDIDPAQLKALQADTAKLERTIRNLPKR